MPNYTYETHKMPDPLLPFIYHHRFEVRTREKVPNWHENIEILQAVEGSGYVHCGIERFDFSAGDLFVINADTLHGIGSDERLVYRCLIVDNSFFLANGIPVEKLRFQNVIRDGALFSLFDAVTAAYLADRADFRSILDIRFAVLQLLQNLCHSYITLNAPTPSDGHVKKAIAYISTHLSEPITLDTLAAHVGIGKFHLSRRFKAFTGKTVVQVINLMRCTEARRLMEGGLSVSAAAASCGFENLSYFTRTFKSLLGILPSNIKARAK
jgi:AraC-like DNA-binding protein